MMASRAELEAFRGHTLPDLLGPDVRLLFVGINPGLLTAAVQAHFARRGNRFYPALFRAGIVDRLIDASSGYDADDLEHLHARGIGITNLYAGRLLEPTSSPAQTWSPESRYCGHSSARSGLAPSRCSVSRRTASRSRDPRR